MRKKLDFQFYDYFQIQKYHLVIVNYKKIIITKLLLAKRLPSFVLCEYTLFSEAHRGK